MCPLIESHDESSHAMDSASYASMKKKTSPLDIQEGGGHYKDMAIQPVEFIHANQIPFIEGNVIKYICRYKKKNGKQDLLKIKHFVDLLIELEYGDS